MHRSALAGALGAVLGLLFALVPSGALERLSFDALTVACARAGPPEEAGIIVVELDPGLLRRAGVPGEARLKRRALAELVASVTRFRPRAIGLDVQLWRLRDAAEDRALADAIQAAGSVIVPGNLPGPSGLEDAGGRMPIPPIAAAARNLGFVTLPADTDGSVRRVRLVASVGLVRHFHFSILAAAAILGTESIEVRPDSVVLKNRAPVPQVEIPAGRDGAVWIRFASHRPLPVLTATDVLAAGDADARLRALLGDQFVLIGGLAPIFPDQHRVPLSRFDPWRPAMPGALVLGQIVHDVVKGALLEQPLPVVRRSLLILAGLGGGVAFHCYPGLLALVMALLAALAVAIHAFLSGTFLDVASLMLLLVVVRIPATRWRAAPRS